jgi:hypothetical protein
MLHKQGVSVRSWKSRFFELTAAKITYYEGSDPVNRKWKGDIVFDGSCYLTPSKSKDSGNRHCFQLQTATRTFYFSATSAQEKTDWMRAIQTCVSALPPNPGGDRPISDRPISDRPISDRPISDRPIADRPAAVAADRTSAYQADASGSDSPRTSSPVSSSTVPTSPSSSAPPLNRSLSVMLNDSDPPLRTGLLSKKGFIRKNWKQRWFVLRPTALSYYRSDKDKEPRGSIPISNKSVLKSSSINSKPGFELQSATSDRVYLITCASEAERDEWVSAIERLIQAAVD